MHSWLGLFTSEAQPGFLASKNPGGAKNLSEPQHFKSPRPRLPPSTPFLVKKNFPDITIAFVALFPISISLFPMLHQKDSDNIRDL
jgi:hypothetical protein